MDSVAPAPVHEARTPRKSRPLPEGGPGWGSLPGQPGTIALHQARFEAFPPGIQGSGGKNASPHSREGGGFHPYFCGEADGPQLNDAIGGTLTEVEMEMCARYFTLRGHRLTSRELKDGGEKREEVLREVRFLAAASSLG